ncbi:E1-E2 ATPase family protein [Cryptosporidium andersoni]|uniref:E1-E2 ATPase family protein n=1 Tax=Cryptosporidium andersoni TaxID=117008 RepID=A0A1J4MN01_9CRYT|nr:E1-E2 ATPase family protein [Cryptosporidium andersoni]
MIPNILEVNFHYYYYILIFEHCNYPATNSNTCCQLTQTFVDNPKIKYWVRESKVDIDEVELRYFTTGLKKYIYSKETNSFSPQKQSKETRGYIEYHEKWRFG